MSFSVPRINVNAAASQCSGDDEKMDSDVRTQSVAQTALAQVVQTFSKAAADDVDYQDQMAELTDEMQQYPDLFRNKDIEQVERIPSSILVDNDIDMDAFLVADKGCLATHGVGPCFAFCLRGKKANGQPVIGMFHFSSIGLITGSLHKVKNEMVQMGCLPETIQTYVIGGMSWIEDEKRSGSIDEEMKILSIARKDKIVGVRFNILDGDPNPYASLSVVMTAGDEKTPGRIFFSKNLLFDPTDEQNHGDSLNI